MAGILTGRGHRRRARREVAALAAEVPLAADLLAMALASGLTPRLALEVVAGCGPPRIGARIGAVLVAGGRLAEALEAEAGECAPLEGLCRLLADCERHGAPAGAGLARLAADARARARHLALLRARTVPVTLLFPLVFLVLPAFVVLTVAPVLLAGFAP